MKTWTAHLSPDRPPVLVREGFAWWGLVFGPFWLFAQRAWVAGVVVLCVDIILGATGFGFLDPLLAFAVGLFGNDIRRLSLDRRGFFLAHVVAARDADAAYARLLAARPDLTAAAAR